MILVKNVKVETSEHNNKLYFKRVAQKKSVKYIHEFFSKSKWTFEQNIHSDDRQSNPNYIVNDAPSQN